MDQALALQPVVQAEPVHKVGRRLLHHASPDAALDILAGSALQHHHVHPSLVEEMGEQQAGGAGADDGDLGAHTSISPTPLIDLAPFERRF
jgi:hypothetical protein